MSSIPFHDFLEVLLKTQFFSDFYSRCNDRNVSKKKGKVFWAINLKRLHLSSHHYHLPLHSTVVIKTLKTVEGGYTSFRRKPLGRLTVLGHTFGQQIFGQKKFGQQTFVQQIFGQ
jgi:hypothetical protein